MFIYIVIKGVGGLGMNQNKYDIVFIYLKLCMHKPMHKITTLKCVKSVYVKLSQNLGGLFM